jgi:uncharacterized protein (TIGR04255 family)
MPNLPKKLNKDPIIEALFEIRFRSHVKNVKDILPGMLYPKVEKDYPTIENLQSIQIPIPAEILQQNPAFVANSYKPSHRLRGKTFTISLGEKVCSLSSARPYQGWKNFQEHIQNLLNLLRETKLIAEVERVSMKYINLLPQDINPVQLNMLELKAELGNYDLKQHSVQLRAEISKDEFTCLVQVNPQTHVRVHPSEEDFDGLLLDIDTLYFPEGVDFWGNSDTILEKLHETEKALFYDMLTAETLASLDPVYAEGSPSVF